MKYLAIAGMALMLGGCSATSDMFGTNPLALFSELAEKGRNIEDKTFDAAASAIDQYCDNAPEDLRLYLREGINSRTERGDVVVTCN